MIYYKFLLVYMLCVCCGMNVDVYILMLLESGGGGDWGFIWFCYIVCGFFVVVLVGNCISGVVVFFEGNEFVFDVECDWVWNDVLVMSGYGCNDCLL